MFTTIFLLLFITFFLLGFIIGKKFTFAFRPKLSSLINEKGDIDLSSQYDTLIEINPPLSFLGVNKDKLDIVTIKSDSNLTSLENQIQQLLQNNQIYLRVIVIRKD